MHEDPGGSPVRDRIGSPHHIDLTTTDFKTIVMKRASWKAHSSVLEGHALLIGCRRIVRCRSKHNSKVVFLVDAKSVLGACAKGRSSAVSFKSICRCFAAMCMAANILPKLVYIPSECNPSDAPSRGKPLRRVKRTKHKQRSCRSRYPWSKLDNLIARYAAAARNWN